MELDLKTKDKPMLMKWLMLILTLGIGFASVDSSVLHRVVFGLCVMIIYGMFVVDWNWTNNRLEEWEIENQKFESEC